MFKSHRGQRFFFDLSHFFSSYESYTMMTSCHRRRNLYSVLLESTWGESSVSREAGGAKSSREVVRRANGVSKHHAP